MVGRCKLVFPFATVVAVAGIVGNDAIYQPLQAQPGPTIVCSYDPSTGSPNPLGMRASITMMETNGTTEVTYEQFGSFVPGPVEAVLTTERTLIFPDRSIDQTRQVLLNSGTYYRELVGFDDPEGFAPVNNTLVCRAEAVASPSVPRTTAELPEFGTTSPREELPNLGDPLPNSGTPNSSNAAPALYDTVAALADGNYRYVSGSADERAYSDQELLSRGGVLFVFRKTGEELIGSYSYIDGKSICVTGRISGNTVTGQAYPGDGTARDLAEEFSFWGPATFLQVRRTQGSEGSRYYGSAILELNDFSRINAGSSLPPSSCQ
ncbi:MAG: hypothetical protein AAF959_07945 [Cyanobacteria bacterium P01_D01_bin.56]